MGPGDEVISTPMTFVASISSILHAGATPVLADIDPHTLNIDPKEIRKKITNRTKAILVVHLTGRPADMDEILSIASDHDIHVLEDAAQAIGATYKNKPVGTIGIAGGFSLHPLKNLGAPGDAER